MFLHACHTTSPPHALSHSAVPCNASPHTSTLSPTPHYYYLLLLALHFVPHTYTCVQVAAEPFVSRCNCHFMLRTFLHACRWRPSLLNLDVTITLCCGHSSMRAGGGRAPADRPVPRAECGGGQRGVPAQPHGAGAAAAAANQLGGGGMRMRACCRRTPEQGVRHGVRQHPQAVPGSTRRFDVHAVAAKLCVLTTGSCCCLPPQSVPTHALHIRRCRGVATCCDCCRTS